MGGDPHHLSQKGAALRASAVCRPDYAGFSVGDSPCTLVSTKVSYSTDSCDFTDQVTFMPDNEILCLV